MCKIFFETFINDKGNASDIFYKININYPKNMLYLLLKKGLNSSSNNIAKK